MADRAPPLRHCGRCCRWLDGSAFPPRKRTCGECIARLERFGHITEADLQADVMKLARVAGWRRYHTRDSRRSHHGFPDLVLVRKGVLVFLELKAEDGIVTDDQQAWLLELQQVPGVVARIMRPSDWNDVERVLTSRPGQPARGSPAAPRPPSSPSPDARLQAPGWGNRPVRTSRAAAPPEDELPGWLRRGGQASPS